MATDVKLHKEMEGLLSRKMTWNESSNDAELIGVNQNNIRDGATATWLLKRAHPAGMIWVLDEDVWYLVKRDTKRKGRYKREETIDIEKKRNIADVIEKLVAFDYLKFDGTGERIDRRLKRYILTRKGTKFQSWEQERKSPFKGYKQLENTRGTAEEKLEMPKKKHWSLEEAQIWQKLIFAVFVLVAIYGIMNVLMLLHSALL